MTFAQHGPGVEVSQSCWVRVLREGPVVSAGTAGHQNPLHTTGTKEFAQALFEGALVLRSDAVVVHPQAAHHTKAVLERRGRCVAPHDHGQAFAEFLTDLRHQRQQPRQVLGLRAVRQLNLVQTQVHNGVAEERKQLFVDRLQNLVRAQVANAEIGFPKVHEPGPVFLRETALDDLGVEETLGCRVTERLDFEDDVHSVALTVVDQVAQIVDGQGVRVLPANGQHVVAKSIQLVVAFAQNQKVELEHGGDSNRPLDLSRGVGSAPGVQHVATPGVVGPVQRQLSGYGHGAVRSCSAGLCQRDQTPQQAASGVGGDPRRPGRHHEFVRFGTQLTELFRGWRKSAAVAGLGRKQELKSPGLSGGTGFRKMKVQLQGRELAKLFVRFGDRVVVGGYKRADLRGDQERIRLHPSLVWSGENVEVSRRFPG